MALELGNNAYCIEYFYAKSGYGKELAKALLKLVKPTQAELGFLQYDVLQDNLNPDLIILLVKFSNQETMRQHEQQAFIKKFSENELKQYCEKFLWNDAREIITCL